MSAGPSIRPAAQAAPGAPVGAPAEAAARLYLVLTWVPRSEVIRVGALGPVRFPRGWYAYVGSAERGREARVARHLRAEKPLRWHADYLFSRHPATRAWLIDVPAAVALPGLPAGSTAECAIVLALLAETGAGPGAADDDLARRDGGTPGPFCPGFGSSDCGCRGHLLAVRPPQFFEPSLERVAARLGGRVLRFTPGPAPSRDAGPCRDARSR